MAEMTIWCDGHEGRLTRNCMCGGSGAGLHLLACGVVVSVARTATAYAGDLAETHSLNRSLARSLLLLPTIVSANASEYVCADARPRAPAVPT